MARASDPPTWSLRPDPGAWPSAPWRVAVASRQVPLPPSSSPVLALLSLPLDLFLRTSERGRPKRFPENALALTNRRRLAASFQRRPHRLPGGRDQLSNPPTQRHTTATEGVHISARAPTVPHSHPSRNCPAAPKPQTQPGNPRSRPRLKWQGPGGGGPTSAARTARRFLRGDLRVRNRARRFPGGA